MTLSRDKTNHAVRVEDYSHLSRRGRHLVERFRSRVISLVAEERPSRVLEVGCGQGWLLAGLAGALPDAELTGMDIRAEAIEFAGSLVPSAKLAVGDAHALDHPDGSFDVVVCSEVLEHVDDPAAVLRELERVCSRTLILSVPWEPWFWLANLVRGKYPKSFGNCPGHVHHWTAAGFRRLLTDDGREVSVTVSFPWTIARVSLKS